MTSDVCLYCLRSLALKAAHTWYSWVSPSPKGSDIDLFNGSALKLGQEGPEGRPIMDLVDRLSWVLEENFLFPMFYSTFSLFVLHKFLCVHSDSMRISQIIVALKRMTFIFHTAFSVNCLLTWRFSTTGNHNYNTVITERQSILDILDNPLLQKVDTV